MDQKLAKYDKGQFGRLYSYLSWAQAVYYGLTGVWALVSIRTFMKVTGPKVDVWLVKTVGVLITVIAAVLGLAGRRGKPVPEVPLLAVGSAASLTAIDVYYVARKRISPIYLLDAVGELGLIGLWAAWWQGRPKDASDD